MPFQQSWIYTVGKKYSGKADQSILASGGSEHAWLFSVAMSWGNKMNFSLCANMLSFAQTVTYKHITMHIDPVSLNQIHCIMYVLVQRVCL